MADVQSVQKPAVARKMVEAKGPDRSVASEVAILKALRWLPVK